ncbi:MAG: TIGR03986 family CRISPR-associated RAMP protein, partial [Synergistes sp.]|nr:TIGR03986 family CRISPR-associated RAMP protein [Synergistes sp.]
IVMTGQPSDRTNRGAKHLEFIFFAEKGESDRITVPDDKKEDFIFIHSTLGENRKPNREWGFWKKRGGPIPVFYKTVVGNDKQLESFGLAYMYRLAYEKNIFEAIANTSPQHCGGPDGKPDFAETLFGRAEKNDSLRGRVNVEPLIAVSTPESSASVKTVLGTPRPTYYPNYIKQEPSKQKPSKQKPSKVDKTKFERYMTFMDPECEIRGWKRYISRKEALSEDKLPQAAVKDGSGDNVSTTFTPLPAETVFTGKIHFHNVKPEELGAIVWALTWGDRNGLRHSLGMAKPYGFGGITVTIDETHTDLRMCGSGTVPTLKDCMAAFVENTMNPWLKGIYKPKGENAKTLGETKEVKLEETDEVKALLAMADPNLEWDQLDGRTVYPVIGKDNSFVSYKNNMEFLTFDPPKQKKADPPKAPAAPPVKKADLTPAMKLVKKLQEESCRLNCNMLKKCIKDCKASPETSTTEERKEVHDAIWQRVKPNPDQEMRKMLEKW